MNIERSYDIELITRIMTNPAVYSFVSDDGSPDVGAFCAHDDEAIYYLLVLDDERVRGLYMLHPMNYITYEIHTCLLKSCRGESADEAAKLVLKWVFTNTPCLKVITNVPENNPLALKYAKRAGLIVEGINRDSFLKDGKLYSQTLLGITREESCQP